MTLPELNVAFDCNIHELRFHLHTITDTIDLFTGNQGRCAAEEAVQNNAVGHGGLLDQIGNQ